MNLIPYDFNSKQVQVLVDENGEPWFIAMEIAEILGYSDAYEMTKRLDDDEKQNRQIAGLDLAALRPSTSLGCTRPSSAVTSRRPSRSSAG